MDRTEALLSIAEIAVSLAGFGGIFMALSRERSRERNPADSYRLVMLLGAALSALVLSLVPVALLSLEIGERETWCVASGSMAVVVTTLLVVTARMRREHREEIRAGEFTRVALAIWVIAVALLAAQLGNVAGLFGSAAFGVYFGGLVFLIAFDAYLFARMLFLWRS